MLQCNVQQLTCPTRCTKRGRIYLQCLRRAHTFWPLREIIHGSGNVIIKHYSWGGGGMIIQLSLKKGQKRKKQTNTTNSKIMKAYFSNLKVQPSNTSFLISDKINQIAIKLGQHEISIRLITLVVRLFLQLSLKKHHTDKIQSAVNLQGRKEGMFGVTNILLGFICT